MTNFALVLWLYQDSGSALKTAMLTVCSYAPYVLLSIFAGVISDRWNKKAVMLVCAVAWVCTWGQWLACSSAIWHASGSLTIYYIGSNGQDRSCRLRISVGVTSL